MNLMVQLFIERSDFSLWKTGERRNNNDSKCLFHKVKESIERDLIYLSSLISSASTILFLL